MTRKHTLMAVHAEDGVTEFEAPGATPQQAVNSAKALEVQDKLAEEYGEEANCAIIPKDISIQHPVIEIVEESMPDIELQSVVRNRV